MSASTPLVAAALLGVDRLGGDPRFDLPGVVADAAGALTGAERLIALAAALGQHRRCGAAPPLLAAEALEPCPPDARRAGPRVEALFPRLIAAGPDLVAEGLAALARSDRSVPPACLPALFDLARRYREIREPLLAAQGTAGPWLAALNPSWSFAAGAALGRTDRRDDAGAAWRTGTLAERLAVLARAREADPAAGLELVRSTWHEDPPDERASFVRALHAGLAPADEPFLEEALTDPRKPVRAAAAELLCRLPGSRYTHRMQERARRHVRVSETRRLVRGVAVSIEVVPPEDADRAMKRDGLERRAAAGLGASAALLSQIIARTPLETWSAGAATPDALVAAARKTDWSEALIAGWGEANAREPDPAWTAALLEEPAQLERAAASGALAAVIGRLPDAARRGVVQRAVRGELGAGLLRSIPGVWPPELARAVLDAVGNAGAARPPDRDTAGRAALELLAARAHPGVFGPLRRHLNTLAENNDALDTPHACLALLDLRETMHKEFADE